MAEELQNYNILKFCIRFQMIHLFLVESPTINATDLQCDLN